MLTHRRKPQSTSLLGHMGTMNPNFTVDPSTELAGVPSPRASQALPGACCLHLWRVPDPGDGMLLTA